MFHSDDDGRPTVVTHERAGYLDAHPIDLGENARRDMVRTLEEMGVEVEASRHEISPGQHGIDLKPMGLMEAADGIVTFRSAVRSVAKRHGLHATFMPKPLGDAEGSGVHLHFTLCKDGKNVFAGEEKGSFSEEAAWFAGGLLTHMKAMAVVSNPLVNSTSAWYPGRKRPQSCAGPPEGKTVCSESHLYAVHGHAWNSEGQTARPTPTCSWRSVWRRGWTASRRG